MGFYTTTEVTCVNIELYIEVGLFIRKVHYIFHRQNKSLKEKKLKYIYRNTSCCVSIVTANTLSRLS